MVPFVIAWNFCIKGVAVEFRGAKERALWSREVAAHVAEGLLDSEIWRKLDITEEDLHQIYALDEFIPELTDLAGADFAENWRISREEESLGEGLRSRIRENLGRYFDALEDIAMSETVTADTRAKILMKFIDSVKGLQPTTHTESVKMNRATVELFLNTEHVIDEQREKYRGSLNEPEE